jgi:hypothetical protein
MQGKDRPKKSRKKELKLSVTYEGWVRRSGKKEAYLAKTNVYVLDLLILGSSRNLEIQR